MLTSGNIQSTYSQTLMFCSVFINNFRVRKTVESDKVYVESIVAKSDIFSKNKQDPKKKLENL